jgi:ADP-heptose:LPS heptosyltransferase
MASSDRPILVHLAAGIGNIVLATPMLVALYRCGYIIDLRVDGDYPETAELFSGWSAIRTILTGMPGSTQPDDYTALLPAIPPFYWNKYVRHYGDRPNSIARPPDSLFFDNEQYYYLQFARAVGCPIEPRPACFLPVAPDHGFGVTAETVVLAPGCKTGVMAAKRWPYYPSLAECFDNVVIVGTEDDLCHSDGARMSFPGHVRLMVGQLSLRQTAAVLAAAGVVVANDSGLGHVAASVGTPTILIFGPTPASTLGPFAPNVTVVSAGLPCSPCWFQARFAACNARIDCLSQIDQETVRSIVSKHIASHRMDSVTLPNCYLPVVQS